MSKPRETASLADTIPPVTALPDVAADEADVTAALIAGLAASGRSFMVVPRGVKFDRSAFLASEDVPVGTVLLDLSEINDWQQGGTTAKSFGLFSKDNGPNDTHWYVGSDHHAVLVLNNYGTAGTTSGDERKATLLWAAGQFSGTDEGFRGAAILQFTQVTGQNRWALNLRGLAPWPAIEGNYEYWRSGENISGAGIYRSGNDYIYVSAGAGVTGATIPSHSTGTVSDGGVSWTPVGSADMSLLNLSEEGHLLLGGGDLAATFRHKVTPFDAVQSWIGELVAGGVSQDVLLKLIPTNGAGAETALPLLRATAGTGLRVTKVDGNTDIVAFSDAQGMNVRLSSLFRSEEAIAGNATVTAANRRVVYVSAAAAANIDNISNGADGQELRLVFLDGNSTVRHMIGNVHLVGAANQTFTAFSTLDLHKIPAGITDRWVEVGRSIK